MKIPARIQSAAERLKSGRRSNKITVRDFLRYFGAERRGAMRVQEIRAVLDELDLQTEPDFEMAWIDSPMWLRLKEGVPISRGEDSFSPCGPDPEDNVEEEVVLEGTPSAVEQAEEQSEQAPTSAEPESPNTPPSGEVPGEEDPTYRIGSLPAANRKLITVNQDDPLNKAVTLMLLHDFSQLPVMQGEREVKGMITWKTIGAKLVLGNNCATVGECREDARIVDANRTLFDAIPTIVEYGYVLVRATDKRITGIVTASDLSLQFQALAEPFLLLREIELHVRRLLTGKVQASDLQILAAPNPTPRCIDGIGDLTFGDYVRLFQHPIIWPKLSLRIDGKELTTLLNDVRNIRNDVMHFDPDPMTNEELGTLKRAVRLLQELYQSLPK
jgi:CBS domain-containing protein